MNPVALGFRAHSGWIAAVAVAGSPSKAVVIERRRIETADPAIAGSRQPYHAAQRLSLAKAAPWIARCRERSARLALDAVSAMIADLAKQGHRVVVAGILRGSGRALPELAAILRSHALLHTAEGEFYRDVLAQAIKSCALPVTPAVERELWDRGAGVFHLAKGDLQGRGARTRSSHPSPPGLRWRSPGAHKAATAWSPLAVSENWPVRVPD
jgi:hypothetical protein